MWPFCDLSWMFFVFNESSLLWLVWPPCLKLSELFFLELSCNSSYPGVPHKLSSLYVFILMSIYVQPKNQGDPFGVVLWILSPSDSTHFSLLQLQSLTSWLSWECWTLFVFSLLSATIQKLPSHRKFMYCRIYCIFFFSFRCHNLCYRFSYVLSVFL